ncbi:50S ribosomal L9 C-terminal domain-containing protein, partial [Staphylococcus epidermidis]|uniref:50S ribosomal L9 C-terminal domain-containing protein n=1 Tax=Staphylococcus epidermidis TaxID=1282 RepID=UPI0037D9A7C0
MSRKEIGEGVKKEDDIKMEKGKMELADGIDGVGYSNVGVKLDKEVEGRMGV